MYNLQAPAVDKPDNYSKEKIEELYTKYSQVADDINLERTGSLDDYNIIYIMSETFSDPLKIEGVSISDDPIPMYRKLTEHYLSGESLSQGYGGGTANIEFEALTGISLEALSSNITTPFIQLSSLMNDIPTIMKLVNQQSHKLTAIHPYNTTMYKRLENYQAMGFEDYRFQDDMAYDERIDSNTYISDESAYKELMDILLKSEEKDFIHLVTMQNHKPFVHKYDNVSVQVSGAPYNLEVAHYATGLQYSDEALKDLLDQLDELDEKTIAIFWGDHLPSFYGSEGTELYDQNGRVTMSQTPLLIYTNFDEDTRDIGTISPIYFTNYVLEISQAPVTPFMALLDKLEMVLPAFKKGTYIERETEIKISRDQLKPSTQLLLEDYDLILYDITTGKNYSQNLGFY
ncbi:MAG TPA: LTA synthase family protein [Candidatus Jeotgalibaca pullicola]|nr:LTA synthase family protein [Candidatus Jeotgalibaca pullicola]